VARRTAGDEYEDEARSGCRPQMRATSRTAALFPMRISPLPSAASCWLKGGMTFTAVTSSPLTIPHSDVAQMVYIDDGCARYRFNAIN
jgi:hypothetical protein